MPAHPAIPSQNAAILRRLRRCLGRWVSMPALVECSGSFNVHSRIDELRGAGHVIENRKKRRPGSRAWHSTYRLVGPV